MSEIPNNLPDASNPMRQRPLDLREPFWASRHFRRLVLMVVMALSIVAVLVFHQAPETRKPAVAPLPPISKEIRYDGALKPPATGSPIDMAEKGYQRVVQHLLTTDPDTLAKTAREISYVHYEKHDAELRGEPVKVLALLADTYPIRLDPPVGELEWVYRTVLVDLSGTEGYIVDLIDPPAVREHRALVQVEGIFVRLASYTAWDKEAEKDIGRKAPFLLGRRMRLIKEKAAVDGSEMTPWVVGVGGASIVLVLVWSVWVVRQARRKNVSRLPVTKLS